MDTGENNLSAQADLVYKALQLVDASIFSREEITLLKNAQDHFLTIAHEKNFWGKIIPFQLEYLSSVGISDLFVNLAEFADNPHKNESLCTRLSSCGWATNNYLALSQLLAKDKSNADRINVFLRSRGEKLPIEALLITPFQRLPRLALFSCDWVNAFESFSDDFPGKKAANSLKRKFKRILCSLNQVSKLIEHQNSIKEQNKNNLSELFFNLFKGEDTETQIDHQELLSQKISKDLSLTFIQTQEDLNDKAADLEEKRNELETIERQLEELSQSFVKNRTDEEQKEIRSAALKGITNYLNWSVGGLRNRGANGWFTWFRHGEEGQKRARDLQSELERVLNLEEMQIIINKFLENPATRFNNHSLATYLVDSLSTLKNTPWADTSRYPNYRPFEEAIGCFDCF